VVPFRFPPLIVATTSSRMHGEFLRLLAALTNVLK